MFEDNITATSTLMLVFFGTIMAILGEDFMRQIDSGFAETTAFPGIYSDSVIIFYRISSDFKYGCEALCR